MNEDNIPELTDVVGFAKDNNEFDFNGLMPGKALTQSDIDKLHKQIDKLVKTKITAHSQALYKSITRDIKELIENTTHDTK